MRRCFALLPGSACKTSSLRTAPTKRALVELVFLNLRTYRFFRAARSATLDAALMGFLIFCFRHGKKDIPPAAEALTDQYREIPTVSENEAQAAGVLGEGVEDEKAGVAGAVEARP
jgi:hypothetical protein